MTATANPVAPGAETPAALSNDKRLKEFNTAISKFGEEAALGRDSLPKLAHTVVRAVADGVVDVNAKFKGKDGKECDLSQHIYERYIAADSKKAIHEHSSGGFKGNVSKLRQLVSLGAMTTVDGVDVLQRAHEAREGMKDESDLKLKPAYVFYIEVAREQLKTDKPLTKGALEAMCVKDEADAKTVEGELKRAMGILEKLITGENRDKIKDTHSKTEEAFNALKERLATMVRDAEIVKLRQQAAALGIKLA